MSGQHTNVVAQGEDFFVNAPEEQVAVAARQIPAADAPGEKHVAAKQYAALFREKTKTPGAMSWHFEHLEMEALEGDCVAFFQEQIRTDWLDFPAESETFKEFGIAQRRNTRAMIADPTAMFPLNTGGVADMIYVRMGQEQQVDLLPGASEPGSGILWGIKENPGFGQKEAIGVKNAAGKGLDAHLQEGICR